MACLIGVKHDVVIALQFHITGVRIKSTAMAFSITVGGAIGRVISEINATQHVGGSVTLVIEQLYVTECVNSTTIKNATAVIAEGNAGIAIHHDIAVPSLCDTIGKNRAASTACRTLTERNGSVTGDGYVVGLTVDSATVTTGLMIREGDTPCII